MANNWVMDVAGAENAKQGTFRSLNGAADENIFIGRASKAGFFCFFKVWRDMPYDAVLDYSFSDNYSSILYRVEVKGSSGNNFDMSRGGWSGRQISRAPGTDRTRPINHEDCDFVVGMDSTNGDCYIVPVDVIEATGRMAFSKALLNNYREKWELFMFDKYNFEPEKTRDGLMKETLGDLRSIARGRGITVPPADIKLGRTKTMISDEKAKLVYLIWEDIAASL